MTTSPERCNRSGAAPAGTDPTRRTPLTPEQSALAEEHWGDARRIMAALVRRHRFYGRLRDLDWDGAAAVAVCTAARNHREGAGKTFRSYLFLCCRRQFSLTRTAEEPQGYRDWTGGKEPKGEAPKAVPLDAVRDGGACPRLAALEWEEEFAALVAGLGCPRHREVIRALYGPRRLSGSEYAEALGLSRSAVSKWHVASLAAIRRRYTGVS